LIFNKLVMLRNRVVRPSILVASGIYQEFESGVIFHTASFDTSFLSEKVKSTGIVSRVTKLDLDPLLLLLWADIYWAALQVCLIHNHCH
jgi:hypothetical protein